MKKLIRVIEFTNLYEKESMKKQLNNLGFYCLSVNDDTLEVYVIERIVHLEQRVIELFSLMVKYLALHLQIKSYSK